jgi:hypothetical protein
VKSVEYKIRLSFSLQIWILRLGFYQKGQSLLSDFIIHVLLLVICRADFCVSIANISNGAHAPIGSLRHILDNLGLDDILVKLFEIIPFWFWTKWYLSLHESHLPFTLKKQCTEHEIWGQYNLHLIEFCPVLCYPHPSVDLPKEGHK